VVTPRKDNSAHPKPISDRAPIASRGSEFQSPALERLIRSLSRLPGLGRKSATRIALYLIQADGSLGEELSEAIAESLAQVRRCSRCGAITEDDPCAICTSQRRDGHRLCVVASPVDILPLEKAGIFQGRYFVLGSLISPLDGVQAGDLPFPRLLAQIAENEVKEVILALDSSVEGETTSLYIQRLLQEYPLKLTRLATGIPVGGALAYTDEETLQRAFEFRRPY